MTQVENAVALLADAVRIVQEGLADYAPEDPTEFFRQFLPIPRHLRVLDPQVRLIIGDKGAGKTQLFKALKFAEGRSLLADVARENGHITLPLDRLSWCVGFETEGTAFPSPAAFDEMKGREVDDFRALWLALLVRSVRDQVSPLLRDLPDEYANLLRQSAAPHKLEQLALATRPHEARLVAILDEYERRLNAEDRYTIITYDELDRVSPGDWEVIRANLRGLVQLWAVYIRRWQRIRCKIFLRRDLFERAALRGPDIAKIAWNPADLYWSPGDLYRLMFKRLANASDEMRKYLNKGKLDCTEHRLLGWMPNANDEEDFAPIVKYMFGEHMGKDPSKGVTLHWIPNHLKDGHGRIFPRPFLRLLQEAAKIEEQQQQAERPRLIHHTALRGGLDEVSSFRVEELTTEEFPWLKKVQAAFKAKPFKVPAERRVVLRSLAIDWSDERDLPPETSPDGVLDYLVELGLASVRSNARVDVGDLYLKGLNLKRKGGVARPKL